MLFTVHCIKN